VVNFERLEPLPHIVIQREPEEREIRPRPAFGARVQPRTDRQEHARVVKEQTTLSAEQLSNLRRAFGVVPGRLLILRLDTLDVNERETLERMHVNIVEELTEERDGRTLYRLLAQFPDDATLQAFLAEYDQYAQENATTTALPYAMRRDLFDSLESVSTVSNNERKGRRLQREGIPTGPSFYLDVDLWNPGDDNAYHSMITSFQEFVNSRGGRIAKDPLKIPSLILVKIEANAQLLSDLLQLDLVSLVDLPPLPPPEDSFDLLQTIIPPNPLPPIAADGPLACVVDSGVVAGHPLLRGTVVEEEDFDSGENSPVDQNGHGTQVGGLVVYGDIARRIQNNEWFPQVRLCSAKVLRNHANPIDPDNNEAVFSDEERVEDQLRRAIEYFHRERGCRVFNLSIGHRDRVYTGGRQLPWAELLDELAKRLDIIIVVSAGNVIDPAMPNASTTPQFQQEVLNSLKSETHRLIDPATASLCLTVGAIARRDDPAMLSFGTQLAASPRRCPSPFTRCGPGVRDSVKPEIVAPGGNFAVDSIAGRPRWRTQDPNLCEPTLNFNFASGRLLKAACGTSFAAAQVSHTAARMEHALRNQFQMPPSQNLVRALLVNSARIDDGVRQWLGDQQDNIFCTLGYGQPNVEFCWSARNRVTLVTEDIVSYKTFHVFALTVPRSFLEEKGKRTITITLAYDPATRLSRRDYIATAMWLEIFGGLTTEQIFEYRSKYQGDGEPPTAPDKNKLNFKPGGQTIRMSTVQSRSWHSNQGTMFLNRPTESGDATLHIFVGCQPRFTNPLGEDKQRYALVVTMEHESNQIDLYQEIRATVRTRARIRITGA
jgi:hypothetical protein